MKPIGHIRQHLMQRVAEFVEQRARVIIGKQRRIALGEVADVDRQWVAVSPPSLRWLRIAEHHAPDRLEPRAK